MDERITRRSVLAKLGGLAAVALGAEAWQSDAEAGAGPGAVAAGLVTCVLTPAQTQGPYYIANQHVRSNIPHTGQLYFPDTLTDAVYLKAPYSSRPARTTRNANDSVYRNGGSKSMLTVHKSGSGYVAAIMMGVQRS